MAHKQNLTFCQSVFLLTVYIIDSEQVVFVSDQCMFFDESQVYEVSHGPESTMAVVLIDSANVIGAVRCLMS